MLFVAYVVEILDSEEYKFLWQKLLKCQTYAVIYSVRYVVSSSNIINIYYIIYIAGKKTTRYFARDVSKSQHPG